MLDFTKPLRTRAGKDVVIYATDAKADEGDVTFPIVGAIVRSDGKHSIETWSSEGRYRPDGREHGNDLIQGPRTVEYLVYFISNTLTGELFARILAPGETLPKD